ncbi:MAG: class I SAM-dependent methyltransferase [Gammaproteobacteria bacterium]
MKEAMLEPLLRFMRIRHVLPYAARYPGCRLLDVGCGRDAKLLRSLEPHIAAGVGVDYKAPVICSARLQTVSVTLDRELPFNDRSFDLITLLAVLEHLEHPEAIVRECARLLRPGGGLLLTVPSWHAKPVLEFLAFQLGIVSPEEIADHKRYYNRDDLLNFFLGIPELAVAEHRYFQCRFNNLLFATKIR